MSLGTVKTTGKQWVKYLPSPERKSPCVERKKTVVGSSDRPFYRGIRLVFMFSRVLRTSTKSIKEKEVGTGIARFCRDRVFTSLCQNSSVLILTVSYSLPVAWSQLLDPLQLMDSLFASVWGIHWSWLFAECECCVFKFSCTVTEVRLLECEGKIFHQETA